MIEIKYDICDEVCYFNASSCAIERDTVKGVQVIPTGISKDESGRDRLDGRVVLYQLKGGLVLTEQELFPGEEACRSWYLEFFQRGGHITRAEG